MPEGKGGKDPDDINGDGHRDLVLPVVFGKEEAHERLVVVYGSAEGLDPATRAVYGRRDLGRTHSRDRVRTTPAARPLNGPARTVVP